MKIGDCMKHNVYFVKPDTPIREASRIMVQRHIGTLPIVNEASHLIGLIRMRDLISLALPDFVQLFENTDFIPDFGALEDDEPEPEVLLKPVSEIMSAPVCVESTAGLVRATTLLQENKLNDLPVVDENMQLVGIASSVDIGVAILSNWNLSAS